MLKYLRLALACWRLASLLVYEDGPGDVFARLRTRVGVQVDRDGTPYAMNPVGQAFICLWCMSVWTAAAALMLERFAPVMVDVLAISAAAIGYQRWLKHG